MNILVITGSPHKSGTSALLAEQFIKGASEAGNEVYRFDAAFEEIHTCIACDKCRDLGKGCVFKDSMEELNPKLLEAEVVVFVAPIYYYGMSAQIKLTIDRFYASDKLIHGKKKAAIMLTCEDETTESVDGALLTFKGMTNFLGWERIGEVSALACGSLEDIEKSDYPKQAYELGKSIS